MTIPGVLYWASGSAPADKLWNPFDPTRSLHRAAPGPLPSWASRDYVSHNIAEFERTGFNGGLNYYRAVQPFFDQSSTWKAGKVMQPAFIVLGAADGTNLFGPTQTEQLRMGLPNLIEAVMLDNVGHWSQHEAADKVVSYLLEFLRIVRASL